MNTSPSLSASHKYLLIGSLLAVSAAAWIVGLQVGDSMTVQWPIWLGLWTVMMIAMMLPSTLPTVLLFATVARSREQFGFRAAPTVLFVTGYLITWVLTGIAAIVFDRVAAPTFTVWQAEFVGAALIIAGVYQFTRWKALCLGHCRSSLHFFMEHWRDGSGGAVFMGAYHGLYCVGCCWGLMLALLALGMMNPVWMGLIAVLIAIEKVAPQGDRIALFSGAIFVLAGVGIALGWLPFLLPMGEMGEM